MTKKNGKPGGTTPITSSSEPGQGASKPRDLRILICVPSHGDVKPGFLHSVFRAGLYFQSLPYDGKKEVDMTIVKSSLLPEGRARLVSRGYDYKATHLLFVDTDMKFPADTIPR